jgi:hypothetical protein
VTFKIETIHAWMQRHRRNGAYIEPPVRVQRGLVTPPTHAEVTERIRPLVDEMWRGVNGQSVRTLRQILEDLDAVLGPASPARLTHNAMERP